jgi:hypothetical protein
MRAPQGLGWRDSRHLAGAGARILRRRRGFGDKLSESLWNEDAMRADRLIILAALAVALAACNTLWAGNPTRTNDIGVGISSEPAPQSGEVRQVSYACEGDLTLTATFDDRTRTVTVMQPGMAPVTLPAQIAGAGFGYADKTHELIGKDKDAMWTQDGTAKRCTARS